MEKIGVQQMVAEANEGITVISAEEALKLNGQANVQFVDVRDLPELEQGGTIGGSVHASRGLLEFYVDPESPLHKAEFDEDKQFIFF